MSCTDLGHRGTTKVNLIFKSLDYRGIFTCVIFSIPVLGLHLHRHDHMNVCSIYGSNNIFELMP